MIKVKWIDGMRFYAQGKSGHAILMDSAEDVGGEDSAPRPMEVLLFSLGGCTGMDVVAILRKMRVDFDEFWIEIYSERRDIHPKYYTNIKLQYHFKGENLPKDKIEKAVSLSQERYCSVSAMLGQVAKLGYEVILH